MLDENLARLLRAGRVGMPAHQLEPERREAILGAAES